MFARILGFHTQEMQNNVAMQQYSIKIIVKNILISWMRGDHLDTYNIRIKLYVLFCYLEE